VISSVFYGFMFRIYPFSCGTVLPPRKYRLVVDLISYTWTPLL